MADESREALLSILSSNGIMIRYVENKTEELCCIAVKSTWMAIQFIPNPSKEVCKLALKGSGAAIRYIPEKYITQEILESLVDYDCILKYIPMKLRSKDICKDFVNKDSSNLRFIPDGLFDEDYYIKVVKESPDAINYIKHSELTANIILTAIKEDPTCVFDLNIDGIDFGEAQYIDLVRYNKDFIKYIPSEAFTENMVNEFIDMDYKLISYIPNRFVTTRYLDVIKNNPNYITMIPTHLITEEMLCEAVSRNPMLYKNEKLFEFRRWPKVAFTAIKADISMIDYVPTDTLKYIIKIYINHGIDLPW